MTISHLITHSRRQKLIKIYGSVSRCNNAVEANNLTMFVVSSSAYKLADLCVCVCVCLAGDTEIECIFSLENG